MTNRTRVVLQTLWPQRLDPDPIHNHVLGVDIGKKECIAEPCHEGDDEAVVIEYRA